MSRYVAYASLTLKLALRRLRNRLGLTLLCLLGISLSVGLVVSIPVFSELVSRLVLRQELAEFAEINNRPMFTLRYYCLPSTGWPMTVEQAEQNGGWLADVTRREIGLPIVSRYSQVESPGLLFKPSDGEQKQSRRRRHLLQRRLHRGRRRQHRSGRGRSDDRSGGLPVPRGLGAGAALRQARPQRRRCPRPVLLRRRRADAHPHPHRRRLDATRGLGELLVWGPQRSRCRTTS